jgi:hypothetical protein
MFSEPQRVYNIIYTASMKRKRKADVGIRQAKKPKHASAGQCANATPEGVEHPVLCRLYPQLLTLRQYLLSQLPTSSKKRRRRISQFGLTKHVCDSELTRRDDAELRHLLDSTLIGLSPKTYKPNGHEDYRARDIESFSQQLPESTVGSNFNPVHFLQPEVSLFFLLAFSLCPCP